MPKVIIHLADRRIVATVLTMSKAEDVAKDAIKNGTYRVMEVIP